MFPGSRSCINRVSRVVSSTNPHRRCPRVHSPVSSPSVHTTTFGAHRGAKCAWIHNSMGSIFFNDDDGEFIIASVKQLGRIKFFIHTAGVGLDIISALACVWFNVQDQNQWRRHHQQSRYAGAASASLTRSRVVETQVPTRYGFLSRFVSSWTRSRNLLQINTRKEKDTCLDCA